MAPAPLIGLAAAGAMSPEAIALLNVASFALQSWSDWNSGKISEEEMKKRSKRVADRWDNAGDLWDAAGSAPPSES